MTHIAEEGVTEGIPCSGIAKVAAELVTRNPYQLKKDVVAHDPDSLAVIHVHFMELESDFAEVMDRTLQNSAESVRSIRLNPTTPFRTNPAT